jgi:hypothetical protein
MLIHHRDAKPLNRYPDGRGGVKSSFIQMEELEVIDRAFQEEKTNHVIPRLTADARSSMQRSVESDFNDTYASDPQREKQNCILLVLSRRSMTNS